MINHSDAQPGATHTIAVLSASWDEVLRIALLLAPGLRKRSNPCNDSNDHEEERDDRPDDTPALR